MYAVVQIGSMIFRSECITTFSTVSVPAIGTAVPANSSSETAAHTASSRRGILMGSSSKQACSANEINTPRARLSMRGRVAGPRFLVVPREFEVTVLSRYARPAALSIGESAPLPVPRDEPAAVQACACGVQRSCHDSSDDLSLDHLVRPQQRLWDCEAQGFRRLHVDHQLEGRRLLYGEIGWLGTSKQSVDVVRGALMNPSEVRTIAHETVGLD